MDVRRRMFFKKKASSSGATGGSYTVNFNSQWEATTAVPNPDSTLYDGVYRSASNYNVNSSVAIMYITIKDCSSFKMYVRSYAESNYDYVMVSQLDQTINGNTTYSNATLVKAHTRGNQQSGTALSNYTLVEFTGISSGEHVITVVYRKDSSAHNGDDRGYVLIEKLQSGNGDDEGGSSEGPINIDNYLTIEALAGGLTASLSKSACEYCIDGDGNWKSLAANTSTESINKGQTLSFRSNLTPSSSYGIGTFTISKNCNLKGNCMSMLFGDSAAYNYSLSGKDYAFYKLFLNCTSIKNAENLILPATILEERCYSSMFYGCTNLITAPTLPATTLAYYCYGSMFTLCSSLTTAPELPATTLAHGCYSSMFSNCTSLTTAPELPATTLSGNCYWGMFGKCTSLTTAPKLPATSIAVLCYARMFSNCTSLTTAPELPATSMNGGYCYEYMFTGCTSLTTAPELPARYLSERCYRYMFENCTSLVTAPKLPVTSLAAACYKGMFSGCTSLTTAPELPATILNMSCYKYMFYNCTSLTTAPELPATILAESCYEYMFRGCSKLNKITMLATNIIASSCLNGWVDGVASTGTFKKHKDMTSLPTGTNGIPSGWTVEDYIKFTECTNLTITADDVIGNKMTTTIHYTAICNGVDSKGETVTGFVKEGTVISAKFPQNTSETETVKHTIIFEFLGVTASTVITQGVWNRYAEYLIFETIEDSTFKLTQTACEYSLDEGDTWISLSKNTNTPTVSAGNKIMFKCINPSISYGIGIGAFSSTGKFNIKGNIMSMLYGDDFIDKTDLTGKNYAFSSLFKGCTNVVDAHNLILPATTLSTKCYWVMFSGCTSLTVAPELPSTTLADGCYYEMFEDCTSLTTAPELPATNLAGDCYSSMFYGCTNLITAPELHATTLVRGCYYGMFLGCSKLNKITMLATDISVIYCLSSWVSGVASTGTFIKHKDMTSLPSGASGIPNGWTVIDSV